MSNLAVANEILRQIKAADKWFLGAVAAKNMLGGENELRFNIGRNPKVSYAKVIIELDVGADLYNVVVGRVRKGAWKEIERVEGVFCDQLVPVLDGIIG